MKIFRVGGSVRDALLGLPVADIDYVVVGSSPEQMVAAGFTPVGKDFPVFLHPQTHAEYALARTERKSAPGYRGFVFHCDPDVTIEEDLRRRDLTINAMAIAEDDNSGYIVDPFGGQQDLANKVFRHVSDAFTEDPVRILRVARFAARFNTFTVAPSTMQLMRAMVENGEVDALVPERVWQEMARGLMERQPSRMIDILHETNALTHILPEVGAILASRIQASEAVDRAARFEYALAVRWAVLLSVSGEVSTGMAAQLCAHLKVPVEVRNLALLMLRERTTLEKALFLQPEEVVRLFERCDAFRRPARLKQLIQAGSCLQNESGHFPQQAFLEQAFARAQAIPHSEIARKTMLHFPNQPQQIANAIFLARVDAVKSA